MQIAAGVAAVGLLLGVIALRTSRSSRGQTYSALALNGSALAIYLVLLLSCIFPLFPGLPPPHFPTAYLQIMPPDQADMG